MSRYVILVCGCDDTTRIVRTLNEAQAGLVREICEQVTAASEYGCMPRMEMHDAAGYCDHGREIGDWCPTCPNEIAEAA